MVMLRAEIREIQGRANPHPAQQSLAFPDEPFEREGERDAGLYELRFGGSEGFETSRQAPRPVGLVRSAEAGSKGGGARRSLSELSGVDALSLSAAGADGFDLEPLAAFASLRTLELEVPVTADLEVLTRLEALRHLSLTAPAEELPPAPSMPDLTPLSELSELESLRLGLPWVEGLDWVRGLGALRELQVRRWPALVDDLGPLASLRALEALSLHLCRLPSLAPLRELVALRELELVDGRRAASTTPARPGARGRVDLSPLARLEQLERFLLHDAAPRGLAPLAAARDLLELDLRGCRLDDLSPLLRLTRLETLLLGDACLEDLSLLGEMKSLKTLELPGTATTDQLAALRDALPDARIWVQDVYRWATGRVQEW